METKVAKLAAEIIGYKHENKATKIIIKNKAVIYSLENFGRNIKKVITTKEKIKETILKYVGNYGS